MIRLAKFLSIDPISIEYPELSFYQFARIKNPLGFIEAEQLIDSAKK